MNCRQAKALLSGSQPESPSVRAHLADCASCAGFRQRLEAAHRGFEDHHTLVSAPPDFAARLRAALPRDEDLLGWAALRLLPATLGLVLLLSLLNWQRGDVLEDEIVDPTSAVLSWVLEPTDGDNGS